MFIPARKRVTTLLEYMFEGEIEPTDEGPEEVLDNEGIVFEERPPTLETIWVMNSIISTSY